MPPEALPDAAARRQALDARRSCIVQAPAGSGKTTLLAQRYLRLLSRVEEPESIVAITFTRKAAEEMRGRIVAALGHAARGEQVFDAVTMDAAHAAMNRDREQAWGLLQGPARLRIQTIDAFAAHVARQRPLLSANIGDREVLDDASELYGEAARATLLEIESDSRWSAAVSDLLGHLDNNWRRLEDLLLDMLGRRDQWLRYVVVTPDRAMFETAIRAAVSRDLRALVESTPRGLAGELVALAQFAAANLLAGGSDSPITALVAATELPGAAPDDAPGWQALAELLLTRAGALRKKQTKTTGFPSDAPHAAQYKARFVEVAGELTAHLSFIARLDATRCLPPTRYTDNGKACRLCSPSSSLRPPI
jgi:acetylornithine deacetylase/succinyl-diaminopimelate desuccinylase-like protein